ncbi:MAG: DivIVA domain-containing protein, partial [Propionibacteriaceae bacterium]|nr:DivIVA domain-containing protein [Propionibacteriaceae bacterium]
VAVLILGIAAVAATGRFGGIPEHVEPDVYRDSLPPTPLTGTDLAGVRFGITPRGYAVDQVDDLLDRLAHEIHVRDLELDRLRAERPLTPNDSPMGTQTEDAE